MDKNISERIRKETEYKCLDCGNKIEYKGGLLWNEALTECFYRFKCLNCGSSFNHRLTKEEKNELKERGKQREIKCAICGRSDLLLPTDLKPLMRALQYDNAIIVCRNCLEPPMLKNTHRKIYALNIKPKGFFEYATLLWRAFSGKRRFRKHLKRRRKTTNA